MNTTTHALIAITGVYFRRLLYMGMIVAGIALVVIYSLITWLALSWSGWWLLLGGVIPLTIIALIVTGGLWYVSGKLLPRRLSGEERRAIAAFGSKLFGVVERGKTPYPLLIVLIGKDVLRKRESGFVRDVISDSRSLKSDFDRIRALF